MIDPVIAADWSAELHEAGHALVAITLGREVFRVTGHRYKVEDGMAGCVVYERDPTDPYGESMIALAGGAASLPFAELVLYGHGDTPDELKARRECPLGWERARSEVWALLQRRESQRSLTAFCHAISDGGGEISGRVQEVLRESRPGPR